MKLAWCLSALLLLALPGCGGGEGQTASTTESNVTTEETTTTAVAEASEACQNAHAALTGSNTPSRQAVRGLLRTLTVCETSAAWTDGAFFGGLGGTSSTRGAFINTIGVYTGQDLVPLLKRYRVQQSWSPWIADLKEEVGPAILRPVCKQATARALPVCVDARTS
jgi:hypothetical protein